MIAHHYVNKESPIWAEMAKEMKHLMDEAFKIGTLRAGSRSYYWKPAGMLEGIIETHPDHPPRLHYLDGRETVELTIVDGAIVLPVVDIGECDVAVRHLDDTENFDFDQIEGQEVTIEIKG